MKLIYILNSYSETDASHFTHILHLLEVMAEQGTTITLVIEKPTSLPELGHPSIQVIGLKARNQFTRQLELFSVVRRLIIDGYTKTFIRIAAPATITAAIAHRFFGGESFLWQSGTTHEYDFAQPLSVRKMKWWLSSHLPNWIARKLVHRFVTGPEAMVDYYADIVKVPRYKIVLLYNDIQLERFQTRSRESDRPPFLASHGLESDTMVLLLVHRLSPVRKTLMYLEPTLSALANGLSDRNWAFVVAGEGSELPEAKKLVGKLGLADKVIFLGNVPNRDIPSLYSVADIFVHPTYTEGFPRVLIEAMAAGLPIVSTDAGGTRQLMGELQMAFVVDKSRPDEFSRRALSLAADSSRWAELAGENRRMVERFATPQVARMYLQAIFS